jgi:phosphoribosyl 1,2-cyclic phosphodiesterase
MRVAVLGSGSKGNAVVVEAGGTRLLLDCGLLPKAIRRRLGEIDLELTDIDALLITHAHGDHCAGARRLSGVFRWRTYATKQTHKRLGNRGGLLNFVPVEPGVAFDVDGLRVTAVALPHDMPGTVAWVVEHEGARFALCTDCGHPALDVVNALAGCDTLMVEFNHDEEMLSNGPYPPRLKRRVLSDVGHMSNAQAAQLVRATDTSRLQRLVLAHLSETNNTPRLAVAAAREAVNAKVEVLVAPQHRASPWLDVTSSRAGATRVLESPPTLKHAAPSPEARRGHIVRTLRDAPTRPGPQPAKTQSVAVRRQLSLFAE